MQSNTPIFLFLLPLLYVNVNPVLAGEESSQQGGSSTFTVTIYNMGPGVPGSTILGGPWTDVVPTLDSAGTVTLDLDPPAVISPQTVWITAWANSDPAQGRWHWNDNETQHGAPAQWRNPGGGFGTTCSDWTRVSTCLGDDAMGPDLRFQIWGNPINIPGTQVLLYSQLDGVSDRSVMAGKYTTESDDYLGEVGDCWGSRTPGWSVDRVVLEGTWVVEVDPCEDYTNFVSRCTNDGTLQARVVLSQNTSHVGETVEFIGHREDSVWISYTATIVTNGVSSRAQISVGGYSGSSGTVSVVDPAGCFEPRPYACDAASKGNAEWEADDARWAAEAQQAKVAPVATKLMGNYPNPFNPTTSINYALSEEGFVSLKIYNTLGEEVATLVNEYQVAGIRSAVWNGRNESGLSVASGIYIYRLSVLLQAGRDLVPKDGTAGSIVLSEKMLFLK